MEPKEKVKKSKEFVLSYLWKLKLKFYIKCGNKGNTREII